VRDWPELDVAVLQRSSDAQVSLPQECRAPGGSRTRNTDTGRVSVGLEMEGSASRRLALHVVPACRWDDGARK